MINKFIYIFRPKDSLQSSWIKATKSFYDFTKLQEQRLALPTSNEALSRLHTEDVDIEEVRSSKITALIWMIGGLCTSL